MAKKLLILLVAIGFTLSMVACTTGGRSQRYPYPRYPGQGYPNYPGYPQNPGYPGGGYGNQMEQVRTLADHLKDATAEVVEEATESDANDSEELAIEDLEKLDDDAKDFRDRISNRTDSYGGYGNPGYGDPRYGDPRYGDPRYGQARPGGEAFTELLQSYYSARSAVRDLPGQADLAQDFERVTGIMRNLTRLYGYRFDPDQEYLEPTVR